MLSSLERLRLRSEKRPIYTLDDDSDDDNNKSSTKLHRPHAKEGSCQGCGKKDNLLSCETCNYTYHGKCLLPPVNCPLPKRWKCPECAGPLDEIERILDCEIRPTPADDCDAAKLGSSQILVKQYLVKWKGLSYLHCTWVPEKEFIRGYKSNPRLRTEVNNFHRQASNTPEDEHVPIRPEWITVDRIIASREIKEEKEYFVKWKELPYDECYWELESDIASFQSEIERFNRIQSGKVSEKQKSNHHDGMESMQKEEFQKYESTPKFLSGGSLHPYQLDGLNFLCYTRSKQTHVILADEIGLGKTIQSIAFLASLFEESVAPHLIVAPVSTLRNWEREFATWAPHMNVVTYLGTTRARNIIREYEFFYPKSDSMSNKRKFGQSVGENKQERIKFDVLLTSYEIISLDTALLKPIMWESMIVDECHSLMKKDPKLFSSLKQYSSKHRVLLTGIPLQNNLDELFMLVHFLDAVKFASLEEFQEEFKDINQEEKISRLHQILKQHLLRRVKKDVLKELFLKKELILHVELSSMQKEHYKAILTRDYQILTRKGGAQISLTNVLMELCKLCCHPFMVEGVEPENTNEFNKQLLESSGKLLLLDKMMIKLKEKGHRVLIYSQFQQMLDLLEDYCTYRKWLYERIDEKVGGAERQVRIDRFNAKNSPRFCFLLSTRAGGLDINLATADTVIIYNSDWNPHADLQAMARAHRLGHMNKVMIYRLITQGTVEERMMQMKNKKMVLEHVVVRNRTAQNINQEELDDIIRYGSKELFADDNEESAESRKIHYDDTAIDRLLDREHMENEDALLDDEEENGFLKVFKVANSEYVEGKQLPAQEEPPEGQGENIASANNVKRSSYWEDLLREKYDIHKIEELNDMVKGKRRRKQMLAIEEESIFGLQDASSDEEDDNYEADRTDNDAAPTGAPAVMRPCRKRTRVISEIPLMEGEGRSLRVLGFNQNQRAVFVQILMRFGAQECDWADFRPLLKQKTFDEIHNYGKLFLEHMTESTTDAPTFADGVPKEGLRIEDVLVRIATLSLIRNKVKALSEAGSVLFADGIIARYPGLRGGKCWKEHHDRLLLRALLKHGYGRWEAIVYDKDFRLQEVICQELNLPLNHIRIPGTPQAQNSNPGTSQVQFHCAGTSEAQGSGPGVSETQNGMNFGHVEAHENQAKGTNSGHNTGSDTLTEVTDNPSRAQFSEDQTMRYNYREMQRRQVEFVKKRVLLLEKGLNTEAWLRQYNGDNEKSDGTNLESGHKFIDVKGPTAEGSDARMVDQLPEVESFSPKEILAFAYDRSPDRLDIAELYNEMSKVVSRAAQGSGEAVANRAENSESGENLARLRRLIGDLNQTLSPPKGASKAEAENSSCSSAAAAAATDIKRSALGTDSSAGPNATRDTEMEDISVGKNPGPGVIVLE